MSKREFATCCRSYVPHLRHAIKYLTHFNSNMKWQYKVRRGCSILLPITVSVDIVLKAQSHCRKCISYIDLTEFNLQISQSNQHEVIQYLHKPYCNSFHQE